MCTPDFEVTYVSRGVSGRIPKLTPGKNLFEFFQNQKRISPLILKKLQDGLLCYSTKFELFLQDYAIFFLPLFEGDQLDSILCIPILGEDQTSMGAHGSILASLSDRYRSPATSLFHILSLLASRMQAAEDYKALEYLNEATRYCYDILRNSTVIHDYGLLVNEKADFQPQKMVLNHFIGTLCDTLAVVFRNTEYKIKCDVCEQLVVTEFDERLLSLAIFHLISNACRFSPGDSTITISLTAGEGNAFVAVADEGVGIAPQNIRRIFEPFFTDSGAAVGEENIGIGLGLPIVQKIAELHGGQVLVNSRQNQGTRVGLSIPIIDRPQSKLCLQSDSVRYVFDRFSDLYILLSGICKIQFY